MLGSCLHISPEFFQEHLISSAWHDNRYRDREAISWNTREFCKAHMSINWRRPIETRTSVPEGNSQTVLSPAQTPGTWSEPVSRNETVQHKTEPLVNIIRRPWEIEIDFTRLLTWEERATVWTSDFGACQIGMSKPCEWNRRS